MAAARELGPVEHSNGFPYLVLEPPHEHFVVDRAKLLAMLAPGGRHHDCSEPGAAWSQHVEEHIARRDGDIARADALRADREAQAAAWAEAFCAMFSKKSVSLPAHGSGNATLTLLGALLGWLAERLSEVTEVNDPDEQRAAIDNNSAQSRRVAAGGDRPECGGGAGSSSRAERRCRARRGAPNSGNRSADSEVGALS